MPFGSMGGVHVTSAVRASTFSTRGGSMLEGPAGADTRECAFGDEQCVL